jgi:hypothetical protein
LTHLVSGDAVAGWMNRHQQQVIEYVMEENRILREQIGNRRLRFNDEQRRRLAAKTKKLGRKLLAQVATIVTPEMQITRNLTDDVDGFFKGKRYLIHDRDPMMADAGVESVSCHRGHPI